MIVVFLGHHVLLHAYSLSYGGDQQGTWATGIIFSYVDP